MICKLAKQKEMKNKKIEAEKRIERLFMKNNKICPRCGCEKILKENCKGILIGKIRLTCEDCGYSTEFLPRY